MSDSMGSDGTVARSKPRWGWSSAVLLGLLALICYGQTLNYGFVQDDHKIIDEKRALYESPGAVKALMRLPIRVIFGDDDIGVAYYRPFIGLSFWVNYKLSGVNPASYHALNILIHAINGVLLFYVVLLLAGRMDLAVWSAALFMVHPIHTGTVAWVSGRTDSLALTAMLSAYLMFVLGRLSRTAGRHVYLVLSSTLYLAALLCKEMSITLPLVFLATDAFVFRRDALRGGKLALVLPHLGWLAVVVSYLKLREVLLGVSLPAALLQKIATSPPLFHIPAIYGYYAKMMFYPGPFQVAPLWHFPQSAADPLAWLGWLLVLGMIAALILSGSPLVRMGVFVFAATILPVMYTPYGGLADVFEWWAYTPSVGFVVLLAGGLIRLDRWTLRKIGLGSLLGSVLIAVCIPACWARNPVYRDELTYSTLATKQRPEVAYYYVNIGTFYSHRGDTEKAKSFYQQALKINPRKRLANKNLGVMYAREGDFPSAIVHFGRELALSPKDVTSQVGIGHAYLIINRMAEATVAFDKAMLMDAAEAGHLLNRVALALRPLGRDRAMQIWEIVIRHAPNAYASRLNLGAAYEQAGRYAEACEMWEQALTRFPGAAEVEEIKARLARIAGRCAPAPDPASSTAPALQLPPGLLTLPGR
jgi:Tfp pilus assembly protein PilF